MNLFAVFVSLALLTFSSGQICTESPKLLTSNACIQFSVGPGTGCDWMCNYCANQLGTNNYYFTDGVCTYESGGCVGNPQSGVTYTCCATN
jgi:hypothetical protein